MVDEGCAICGCVWDDHMGRGGACELCSDCEEYTSPRPRSRAGGLVAWLRRWL